MKNAGKKTRSSMAKDRMKITGEVQNDCEKSGSAAPLAQSAGRIAAAGFAQGLFSETASLLANQGYILTRAGEWAKGKELLEQALKLSEQNASGTADHCHEENKFRTALAECYLRLGRKELAAGQYVQVLLNDRWYLDALEGYYLVGAKKQLMMQIYTNPDEWNRMMGFLSALGFSSQNDMNGWDLEPNRQILEKNLQLLFAGLLEREIDFSDTLVSEQMNLLPGSLQELVYIYHGRHSRKRLPLPAYKAMADVVDFLGSDDVKAKYRDMLSEGRQGSVADKPSAAQSISVELSALASYWQELSVDRYNADLLRRLCTRFQNLEAVNLFDMLKTLYQREKDGRFVVAALKGAASREILLYYAEGNNALSDLERQFLSGQYESVSRIAAGNIWNVCCGISCMLVEDATYGENNEAYKAKIRPLLPRMYHQSALACLPDPGHRAGRTIIRRLARWHIGVAHGRFFNQEQVGMTK